MNSTYHHHQTHHPKREPNEDKSGILYPPSQSPSTVPLKVNKDSHVIKKPPSLSSAAKPRHPVIIYTRNPKVIRTNPKDFMALVQKLTGMSPEESAASANVTTDPVGKSINRTVSDLTVERRKSNRDLSSGGEGNNTYQRSYSGIGSGVGINYGNYLPTLPIFPPANPVDDLFSMNQPFPSFDDPIFFAPNMRNSFSSSSSSSSGIDFDGLMEFRDF